jgi:hypothetical protein
LEEDNRNDRDNSEVTSVLSDFDAEQTMTRGRLYERIYDSVVDGTNGKDDFVGLMQASHQLAMKESAAAYQRQDPPRARTHTHVRLRA